MSYSGRVNEKFGEIMKEVKLLQRIRNDYVVELIGTFLKEKEYSAWIIMEYCLGSVSDCVEVRVINSKSIFLRIVLLYARWYNFEGLSKINFLGESFRIVPVCAFIVIARMIIL